MARIKMEDKLARTETFNAIDQASKAMNETNDCTVKAAAIAFNIEYAVAHRIFAEAGRRPRKGVLRFNVLKAYGKIAASQGKKLVQCNPQGFINQYPKAHQILKNITTHHPKRFNKVWRDGFTYIVFTSCHVGVVVNGTNHDWTVGRAKRVEELYRIVEA